ncbi:NAD(P)/FAD-dependent oxidoreductase [Hymenobacter cellulosilyticus]|uniref:Tryptophan 7-halogenase n=1 Tax=Hymenobacter cellulosilyticus TaxID=2932248 RepID=A0A8T9Q7Y5_9BACT|nr:tryptophan 7-halogenase [Hymenobacter cellulosilyticus]UOQ71629.1 tryptophan 7-halogenase [Hymenobacter cellulosilyticus]
MLVANSVLSVVDVLIVGGGPAGSAAAIWAARAGAQVVLLEHRAFPRARPGETLHPGVEPILHQLGVAAAVNAAGFLRHSGYWVRWGDSAPRFEQYGHDAHGPWLGYQAERATLDAVLLREAVRLGVQVRQPCQALDLLRAEDGRPVGIRTSQGLIRARVILDASGRQQWLARRLRLTIIPYSAPLTAYYGYLYQEAAARQEPSLLTDAGGWRWTAPCAPTS